ACAPSFPLPGDFWITEWQEAAGAGAAALTRGRQGHRGRRQELRGPLAGRPSARAVVSEVPEATVRKIGSTVRLVGRAKT
ncbi:hypothetical protein, partial [Streptomyces sp. NPDC059744]|uniref:hypothetical protein n=1 Tax=Streptomyces sp. NPDC059744 TaxID=3346929 RepID=UPI003658F6FF